VPAAVPSGGILVAGQHKTNVRDGGSGRHWNLMQAQDGRSGIQPAHPDARFQPEHANTVTALQKRPASIEPANFTLITELLASSHCTGILTAAPEIQAALT
jgi:hypothetical protein